jgi:hypothetical protein
VDKELEMRGEGWRETKIFMARYGGALQVKQYASNAESYVCGERRILNTAQRVGESKFAIIEVRHVFET